MIPEYLILIALIVLSGFFSASEIALVSLSPAKVRTLLKQKISGANHVSKLKQSPSRFLATILIGNNVVNISASALATVVFTQQFGQRGVGIAIGIMTLLILMFGEIFPKNFAQAHAIWFATSSARAIYIMEIIFTPAIWILEKILQASMKFFKSKEPAHMMTEEELKAFASIGVEQGIIQKEEQELIENILEFNDIKVEEVMTPRTEIDALDDDNTLRETLRFMTEESHHTRIPVFRMTIDDIIGFVSVKDMLGYVSNSQLDKRLKEVELMPVFRVPSSMKINRLFHEFQKRHMHTAIVVDEHGGTAGLATLEDVLEEIVGEIEDEADIEEKNIEKLDKHTVRVQGRTTIQEINEWFKVKLSAPEHKPVSYLMLEHFERFPREGENVTKSGLEFTIEKMDGHMIKKVRVEKIKSHH